MPRWAQAVFLLGSAVALSYELWALLSGAPTISRLVRNAAEAYHPVYWFGGIITGFLIVIEVYGAALPRLIRIAVLTWIITSAHIFWFLG